MQQENLAWEEPRLETASSTGHDDNLASNSYLGHADTPSPGHVLITPGPSTSPINAGNPAAGRTLEISAATPAMRRLEFTCPGMRGNPTSYDPVDIDLVRNALEVNMNDSGRGSRPD